MPIGQKPITLLALLDKGACMMEVTTIVCVARQRLQVFNPSADVIVQVMWHIRPLQECLKRVDCSWHITLYTERNTQIVFKECHDIDLDGWDGQ